MQSYLKTRRRFSFISFYGSKIKICPPAKAESIFNQLIQFVLATFKANQDFIWICGFAKTRYTGVGHFQIILFTKLIKGFDIFLMN